MIPAIGLIVFTAFMFWAGWRSSAKQLHAAEERRIKEFWQRKMTPKQIEAESVRLLEWAAARGNDQAFLHLAALRRQKARRDQKSEK